MARRASKRKHEREEMGMVSRLVFKKNRVGDRPCRRGHRDKIGLFELYRLRRQARQAHPLWETGRLQVSRSRCCRRCAL